MLDIVIPTYNRAEFLEQAIESVLKQDDSRYRLYVLDNQSTDNTSEIVRKFETFGVQYIVNEDNLGMVGNWNRALQTGVNDLLHIFHDDDILTPSYVSGVLALHQQYPGLAFSHTGAVIIDESGKMSRNKLHSYTKIVDGREFLLRYLTEGISIVCPTVVLNRGVIPKQLSFDGELPFTADINFFVRASRYGGVGYIRSPLVKYRVHLSSETSSLVSNIRKKILDRHHYAKELEIELHSRNLPDSVRDGARGAYLKGALSADIWFARRNGATRRECMKVAFLAWRSFPKLALYSRFYINVLKVQLPQGVINGLAALVYKLRNN